MKKYIYLGLVLTLFTAQCSKNSEEFPLLLTLLGSNGNIKKSGTVSQVLFGLPPGDYTTAGENVTLSSGTPGASIYYTTDGSIPTTSSTAYTGSFSISADTTIKAIALKTGMNDSPVGSAVYTFNSGTATYAVGGWVSGLYGGTIVLQNNNGDDLTLTGNGSFFFATPVAAAVNIRVTVLTQPSP